VKVSFLGTSSAIPTARQNNVCFVAHASDAVLFECGPSILYQLAAGGIAANELRTVIISHVHGDHSLGLPMFLIAAQLGRRSRPLTVCLPEPAIEALQRVCLTVYPSLGETIRDIEWLALPADRSGSFELAGGRLLTAPAEHSVPAVASAVTFPEERRAIAFSGDTSFCPGIAEVAKGVDLLAHESNWSVKLGTELGHGHSTAEEAGKVAALAGAKRLALVHRSGEIWGHERVIQEEASSHFGGAVLTPMDFSEIEL